MNTGKEKEAYTNLIYKFFTSGYDKKQLPLYEKILTMVKQKQNSEVTALANAFVFKLKEESQIDTTDNEIAEEYKDFDSSTLYDRLYNQLMGTFRCFILSVLKVKLFTITMINNLEVFIRKMMIIFSLDNQIIFMMKLLKKEMLLNIVL